MTQSEKKWLFLAIFLIFIFVVMILISTDEGHQKTIKDNQIYEYVE